MSTSAASQQFDIKVMSVLAAPVMIFVLVFVGYAMIVWRHREGDEEDGPPHLRPRQDPGHLDHRDRRDRAVPGRIRDLRAGRAWLRRRGRGRGPEPDLEADNGTPLQVQVIAQQWRFTYRYPQFGGFETTQLMLPVGEPVQFNVTSIDVIHSFWAYQLGVKADANPGVNNVAFTTPIQTGTVTVRCAELCGLWHGAMFDYGRSSRVAAFQAWAARTETSSRRSPRSCRRTRPPYDPTVVPQINKAMAKAGIGGANGYYYPPNDPVQP